MDWGKLIVSKKLHPYQVDEVCKRFIQERDSTESIAISCCVGYSVINRIKGIWLSYQTKTQRTSDSVSFQGWTRRHYDKEDNIIDELELNYDNVTLVGWELQEFNKL